MQHRKAIESESVLESVSPHALGMCPLYLFWAYPVVLGALWMTQRERWVPLVAQKLDRLLAEFWSIGPVSRLAAEWAFSADHDDAYLTCWIAALLLPVLLFAVTRISLCWSFVVGLTGAAALGARYLTPLGDHASSLHVTDVENLVLIAVGLVGVAGTEIYRRSHQAGTANALIREWTAQRSRRELARKRATTTPSKKRAAG